MTKQDLFENYARECRQLVRALNACMITIHEMHQTSTALYNLYWNTRSTLR